MKNVHIVVLLSIDLILDEYEESKIETIDNCTSHCNLCVEMHVYREVGDRNRFLVNIPIKCLVNVIYYY